MTDTEQRQPWERQPWETATAFRRFTDFYLSQSPPRSLDAAYRNYWCQKRGVDPGASWVQRKRATSSWQRWAYARDGDGSRIPGAVTWSDRAASWDDHVAAAARTALQKRQEEVLTSGYAQYWERVADLDALAGLLHEELLDETKRWLADAKMVGEDLLNTQRFNHHLVEQYRKTLDDIASELGERVKKHEVTGAAGAALIPDKVADALSRIYGEDDDGANDE